MTMDYSMSHPAYYHPHYHHAHHHPHAHTASHTMTSSMASMTSLQGMQSLDLSMRNNVSGGNGTDLIKREPFYHRDSLGSLQHSVAFPLGHDPLTGIEMFELFLSLICCKLSVGNSYTGKTPIEPSCSSFVITCTVWITNIWTLNEVENTWYGYSCMTIHQSEQMKMILSWAIPRSL